MTAEILLIGIISKSPVLFPLAFLITISLTTGCPKKQEVKKEEIRIPVELSNVEVGVVAQEIAEENAKTKEAFWLEQFEPGFFVGQSDQWTAKQHSFGPGL